MNRDYSPLRVHGGVTPIAITFMFACYYAADPESYLGTAHWNSEAGRGTRLWLFREQLIGPDNKATSRGIAWVNYICHTPLPVEKWVIPERSDAA